MARSNELGWTGFIPLVLVIIIVAFVGALESGQESFQDCTLPPPYASDPTWQCIKGTPIRSRLIDLSDGSRVGKMDCYSKNNACVSMPDKQCSDWIALMNNQSVVAKNDLGAIATTMTCSCDDPNSACSAATSELPIKNGRVPAVSLTR
jgi:hypothetical protein